MAMAFLRNEEMSFASVIVILNYMANRCMASGAKIANVFAKRDPKPQGDGKSRSSAFYFPKARSALEVIEMGQEHMREQRIEIIGQRYLGAVANGFSYDVYPTSVGNLWFKVPMIEF
jgi:hypothetical protein